MNRTTDESLKQTIKSWFTSEIKDAEDSFRSELNLISESSFKAEAKVDVFKKVLVWLDEKGIDGTSHAIVSELIDEVRCYFLEPYTQADELYKHSASYALVNALDALQDFAQEAEDNEYERQEERKDD